MKKFHNLTTSQKGAIFIVLGLILLLHTLGIFKSTLHLLILFGSLLLILYGIVIGDFWTKTTDLLRKFKKK